MKYFMGALENSGTATALAIIWIGSIEFDYSHSRISSPKTVCSSEAQEVYHSKNGSDISCPQGIWDSKELYSQQNDKQQYFQHLCYQKSSRFKHTT